MNHPGRSRRRLLINAALFGAAGITGRLASAAREIPSLPREALKLEPPVITPMMFGAKADGKSDDAKAFNDMYAYMRSTTSRTVFLRGRRYCANGSIYACDVSTIGEGATLISSVNGDGTSCAFEWGGSDTFVTGLVFDLSNHGKTTMHGILNARDNAFNQRFFGNRVMARTTEPSKLQSNIFGLWVLGTGLNGLYVLDNQFEQCSYGVQVNNQDGLEKSVRKKPLGEPSQHIHIRGNTCIDATIGVNTPHIMCSNVVIEGNTITPQHLHLDLPLNVAHVTELVVYGNTVTSNTASANGTLHIEDASGAVTVSANVITALAANNGIQFGVDPSVSHDARPAMRAVIMANHVQGSITHGETVGILLPDPGTTNTTVTGNYVAGFAQGINAVATSTVFGNTIANCPAPLRLSKDSAAAQNVVK
ncbi:hypothetical protein M0D69_36130 [Caballeronia sp. SEWSISQ10-4 2]|uniref:hypothetical protein n=1 Tax=Caballeronia sp. SEWSISQ10-4 2 TaxID=2937438 RepID=UPI0026536E6F|nr:hypothetical protein [Caballeronia sp. SEWSISQ10-4 2]MDN7183349.1 hypothetical protein [Caballeronia sp. SEWSISQ10-4 2]